MSGISRDTRRSVLCALGRYDAWVCAITLTVGIHWCACHGITTMQCSPVHSMHWADRTGTESPRDRARVARHHAAQVQHALPSKQRGLGGHGCGHAGAWRPVRHPDAGHPDAGHPDAEQELCVRAMWRGSRSAPGSSRRRCGRRQTARGVPAPPRGPSCTAPPLRPPHITASRCVCPFYRGLRMHRTTGQASAHHVLTFLLD